MDIASAIDLLTRPQVAAQPGPLAGPLWTLSSELAPGQPPTRLAMGVLHDMAAHALERLIMGAAAVASRAGEAVVTSAHVDTSIAEVVPAAAQGLGASLRHLVCTAAADARERLKQHASSTAGASLPPQPGVDTTQAASGLTVPISWLRRFASARIGAAGRTATSAYAFGGPPSPLAMAGITEGAVVALGGALEQLAAELIEASAGTAAAAGGEWTTPQHIDAGARGDPELRALFFGDDGDGAAVVGARGGGEAAATAATPTRKPKPGPVERAEDAIEALQQLMQQRSARAPGATPPAAAVRVESDEVRSSGDNAAVPNVYAVASARWSHPTAALQRADVGSEDYTRVTLWPLGLCAALERSIARLLALSPAEQASIETTSLSELVASLPPHVAQLSAQGIGTTADAPPRSVSAEARDTTPSARLLDRLTHALVDLSSGVRLDKVGACYGEPPEDEAAGSDDDNSAPGDLQSWAAAHDDGVAEPSVRLRVALEGLHTITDALRAYQRHVDSEQAQALHDEAAGYPDMPHLKPSALGIPTYRSYDLFNSADNLVRARAPLTQTDWEWGPQVAFPRRYLGPHTGRHARHCAPFSVCLPPRLLVQWQGVVHMAEAALRESGGCGSGSPLCEAPAAAGIFDRTGGFDGALPALPRGAFEDLVCEISDELTCAHHTQRVSSPEDDDHAEHELTWSRDAISVLAAAAEEHLAAELAAADRRRRIRRKPEHVSRLPVGCPSVPFLRARSGDDDDSGGDGEACETGATSVLRTTVAGLQIPTAWVERRIRAVTGAGAVETPSRATAQGAIAGATQLSSGAAVYASAIVEYITAELLELAGDAAVKRGDRLMTVADVVAAIERDEELRVLVTSGRAPAVAATVAAHTTHVRSLGDADEPSLDEVAAAVAAIEPLPAACDFKPTAAPIAGAIDRGDPGAEEEPAWACIPREGGPLLNALKQAIADADAAAGAAAGAGAGAGGGGLDIGAAATVAVHLRDALDAVGAYSAAVKAHQAAARAAAGADSSPLRRLVGSEFRGLLVAPGPPAARGAADRMRQLGDEAPARRRMRVVLPAALLRAYRLAALKAEHLLDAARGARCGWGLASPLGDGAGVNRFARVHVSASRRPPREPLLSSAGAGGPEPPRLFEDELELPEEDGEGEA